MPNNPDLSASYGAGGRPGAQSRDVELRREALQIVAQLPKDALEAVVVLEHARKLVEGFLSPRGVPEPSNGSGGPVLRVVTP